MRIVVASLALSLALPAAAQDLAWKWEEGQHRRFFLQAGIKFQANWPMGAEIRYDFMAQDLLLSAVVDCEATELKKKKTFLTCTLEDVGILAGVGNATGGEVVQNVVDEWDDKLTGARYHTTMTHDGRIGAGELDGIEFRSMNQRTNKITATMEATVDRLFATLDVGLPKPGTAWRDEGWIAKNQMSLMIPTVSGGNGMNKVQYTVDQTKDSYVDATSTGDGSIMEGHDVPKTYAFEASSLVRFDHERGTLLAHVYQSEGELTASSVSLPGRSQGEGQRTTGNSMDGLGGGAQGSRDLGSAARVGDGTASQGFLRGGAYDPNQYLEAGRMYLLEEGEQADVGPTGPMLYPTGDAADPAGEAPAAEAPPAQE